MYVINISNNIVKTLMYNTCIVDVCFYYMVVQKYIIFLSITSSQRKKFYTNYRFIQNDLHSYYTALMVYGLISKFSNVNKMFVNLRKIGKS